MSYRVDQPALMPTALQDPYGRSFSRAFGIMKDWVAQQARFAVYQRFPQFAAPDALGAIGAERNIEQGNDAQLGTPETNAAYALRLKQAWTAWQKGGTAWGMLLALAAQGYSSAVVVQQNGLQFTLSGQNLVVAARPNLTLNTVAAQWGRGHWGTGQWGGSTPWNLFLVYFPSTPSSWTSISNPPTATSVPSIYELRKLRRIIDLWRPAWAYCAGIGVVISGSPAFWGTGAWGTGNWGANVVWFSGSNLPAWGYPIGEHWGASNIPGKWGAQL